MISRTMWRIVTVFTFVLTWSASIAQPSDPFGPESFSCANEGGLNECMQNFTEALMRSGLMKKTQEWQSAHAAISLPELSPAEFEELCQIYGDVDVCLKRTGLRPKCDSNIAVKALDNAFGYMCTPPNKKILMDNWPCVQNLTKTDPRLLNCTTNVFAQLGFDPTKMEQEPPPTSMTSLSNVFANLCPIMNTTFACTEPILVPSCGYEIFDLSVKLAANALKTLNIDCANNGQNPFANATAIVGQVGPTTHRAPSIFDNLQVFCTGNNNGLQECTLDFISHFFNQNGGFSLQNLTGDRENNIFRSSGQFNLNKLDQLCSSSYTSASACISKNNLLQVCPDATFVKAFHGILTPVCDPESRKSNAASIECLEALEREQNFTDTVRQCLQSKHNRPSSQQQAVDMGHMMTGILDQMCGETREFVRCSKKPVIDRCGHDAFGFMVEISQNALGLFDPSCNITEHRANVTEVEHVVPIAEPHVVAGNASTSPFTSNCPAAVTCMQQFGESQANITSMIKLEPGSLLPKISKEQFLVLCRLSDGLFACFEQNDVFTKCENDRLFETLNTAVFAVCEEPHRQVLADNIECVTDLDNRDPTFRLCIAKLVNNENISSSASNNERYFASLCSAVNEAYECARQPVITQCGVEIYTTMLNISATLLEPLSPGCVFTGHAFIQQPVGPPSITVPSSPASSACALAASPCLQQFSDAQNNISISAQPSAAFSMIPNITRSQFFETCQQADTLHECFNEGNIWTQCNGDGIISSLNRTLFTMCTEQHRQVIGENIECVANLESNDPTVRQCIVNFTEFTLQHQQSGTNITLSSYLEGICRAVNEVYECAQGPVINQCGAEIYATIVDVSTPLLDSYAPGCMFSEEVRMVKVQKTTLNPEIKKPTPGVGELVGEGTTEKTSGAVGVVGSLFMLIITAMLVFW